MPTYNRKIINLSTILHFQYSVCFRFVLINFTYCTECKGDSYIKRLVCISIIVLFAIIPENLYCQTIAYKPGNGLHITSANKYWDFLFSGYINSIYSFHNVIENNAIQSNINVHKARIDLGFDYLNDYDLFFEFDAAGQRTEMVLAQIQARIFSSNYLLAGKFINPFSPENNRSISGLSTIERYSGLNSMFLLPALDAQYGLMFFGSTLSLNYYLSITNGNGEAAQNIGENNSSKGVTARLEYKTSQSFGFGASIDYTKEEAQQLNLVDHTFDSFSTANVYGKRLGYLVNFEYADNPYLFRGEVFQYNFNESLSSSNDVKNFLGGYLETGYFLFGNKNNGVQLIGRFETARYGKTIYNFIGPTVLNSYLLGTNWYANTIFTFQLNLIYEDANRSSLIPLTRLTNRNNEFEILSTVQLKF